MAEQEERETDRTTGGSAGTSAGGIARNQNVVYTLPFDAASLAQVLTPVIERVEAHATEPQVVVIAPDADTALTAARVASQLAGNRGLIVLPATGTARAARILRARPAHVVAGAPTELLGLIQGSTLKLERVRVLVLAWLDDVLATGAGATLESIMNEVPKDAARIVVTNRVTEPVEAFVERYLRRARRVGGGVGEPQEAVSLRYLAVAGAARPSALRRLLDEMDPASAAVFVRSSESEAEVDALRRALGYVGDDTLRLVRGTGTIGARDETAGAADEAAAGTTGTGAGAGGAALVILYDLPGSRQELHSAIGGSAGSVIALVPPRQLELLRHLAGTGDVTPLVLSGAPAGARSREVAMREQLRAVLREGPPSRELLALEPLLEEYDGVEVAAAALRLLEREREREQERAREHAAGRRTAESSAEAPSGEWTRIFINVGERDDVRVGDLVGAITGEAGLTREQIGRVELRESHSLVQIAPDQAERVVERLTGTMIRGRRAAARVDRMDGGARGGPRGGPGGAGHGGRGTPRDRAGGGGSRVARGRGGFAERGERGDRPPQAPRDRPPRDRGERSGRGPGDRSERRPRREDTD